MWQSIDPMVNIDYSAKMKLEWGKSNKEIE